MPTDPIIDFCARHDVNAHALVLAIAAVVVAMVLAYLLWATVKGIVRW